jgi:pyruvate formate lyase activating enzyme
MEKHMLKECLYYSKQPDGVVRCELCPHHCTIRPGKRGLCGSRHNLDGVLVSDVYGQPCALADDPIEKKPLLEFHPGTRCLSLACTGCNLRCLFCQNHEISQALPQEEPTETLQPEDVVATALHYKLPGIAYTYTEPLTWYEYVYDIARLAHEHGLWNILVTAGFICQEPLKALLPYIDAANVDLKEFDDEQYKKVNGARLQPVLDTLVTMKEAGVWVEVTNLVVPGVNDDMEMIGKMCEWLVTHGFADQPLHFSRFFPRYKMKNTPPTPLSTLRQARSVALSAGIKHVYLGNV